MAGLKKFLAQEKRWRRASSPSLADKAISRWWLGGPEASLLTTEALQFRWGPLNGREIYLMGVSIH